MRYFPVKTELVHNIRPNNSQHLLGRENEFSIDGPQSPKDDTHKDSDGEGGGRKHDVLDTFDGRVVGGQVGQQTHKEKDALQTHVEEGQVLGQAAVAFAKINKEG